MRGAAFLAGVLIVDGSDREPSLLDQVIEGLANGLLWIVEAGPVWTGRGTRKPCIVCRLKIQASETQFDVPGPRGALPTHVKCYAVWWKQSQMLRKDLP